MSSTFIHKILGRTPRPRSKKRRANGTGTLASTVSNASASVFAKVVRVEEGETGKRGPSIRGPQYWEDLDNGYEFQSGGDNETCIDVVIYDDVFYYCTASHEKSQGTIPGSEGGEGLWKAGSSFDMVATKILLAEYALVENLGVSAIEMYDENGEVVFYAKDGTVTCNAGNFSNVTIDGYLQTKFTCIEPLIGASEYTISDVLNLSAQASTIILPSDSSYIGKRVCIANTNFPPFAMATQANIWTTVRIDDTAAGLEIGIGGNIDMTAAEVSKSNLPAAIYSVAVQGGVVEFIGVSFTADDDDETEYCHWILLNGHRAIKSYETM